jgi:hypothetical protein
MNRSPGTGSGLNTGGLSRVPGEVRVKYLNDPEVGVVLNLCSDVLMPRVMALGCKGLAAEAAVVAEDAAAVVVVVVVEDRVLLAPLEFRDPGVLLFLMLIGGEDALGLRNIT